jgi:hypothetical protein
MPTNADREQDRTSVQHRRAHTGLHAGFGALVLSTFMTFAACDSKGSGAPATERGSGGSFGSGLGGMMMGMGGMTPMGSGTGSGGATGAGGAADPGGELPPVMEMGMSTAKFCNGFVPIDGSSIDLVMELGTKAVRFTVASGKCAPMTGQTCSTIPAGTIPFKVYFMDALVADGVATVTAGKPIVIVAYPDNAGDIQLGSGRLTPPTTCESFELPRFSDAGAPSPTPGPDAGVKR